MHAFVSVVLYQLSLRELISGIPHDAGAIIAYVILFAFVYALWKGSKGKPPEKAEGEKAGSGKSG